MDNRASGGAKSSRHGGILSHIPEGWYSVSEAAKKVGRDPQRLKAVRKTGDVEPSGMITVGKTNMPVYIYNDDDIERLREHFGTEKEEV